MMTRSEQAARSALVWFVLLLLPAIPSDASSSIEIAGHVSPIVSSAPGGFTQVGSRVFFTASTPETGRELWVTDGTPEGTRLVRDINPGPAGSEPWSLASHAGWLYFRAGIDSDAFGLWKSDGTESGTVEVKRFPPSNDPPEHFVSAGENLLLVPSAGGDLWKSDGTTEGTVLIGSISGFAEDVVAVGDKILFPGYDPILGSELWVSDGTLAGTRIVMDISPGMMGSDPYGLTVVGKEVFFFAAGQLWRTDGSQSGTRWITSIAGGLGVNFNGTFYFGTDGGLWKSDGTAAGTVPVKALEVDSVQSFVTVGDKLYFVADHPNSYQLWVSDGTTDGTDILIPEISGNSNPVGGQGHLFFTFPTSEHGLELWKTEGTGESTSIVADIEPGIASSYPFGMSFLLGRLFFAATHSETGIEPWISDGTAAGTSLLLNIGRDDPAGKISGQVFDALTGAPLRATVYAKLVGAVPTQGHGAQTDLQGFYELSGLASGDYELSSSANSGNDLPYLPYVHPSLVGVVVGQTTSGTDLALVQGGRIEGQIRSADPAFGSDWSRSTFRVYGPNGFFIMHGRPDQDGRYRTSGALPGGDYFVEAIPGDSFVPQLYADIDCFSYCDPRQGTPVTVQSGRVTDGIDFTLERYSTVSGSVRVEGTDEPIAGAQIHLVLIGNSPAERREYSLESDSEGRFTSVPLPDGTAYLAATAWGFRSEVHDNIDCTWPCDPLVGSGEVLSYSSGDVTGIDFWLTPARARILGRVTDVQTGEPVSNAGIVLFDSSGRYVQRTTSAVDGTYSFSTVLGGTCYLLAEPNPDTYYSQIYRGISCLDSDCHDVSSGTPVEAIEGSTTSGVDFRLEPLGRIGGRVTDSRTGEPLDNAHVVARDPVSGFESTAGTDAEGNYLLDRRLKSGLYQVFATHGEHYSRYFREAPSPEEAELVEVVDGETTWGIDISLDPKMVISGVVSDALTGAPLTDMQVVLYPSSMETRTDGAGRYEMYATEGEYRLFVRDGRFSPIYFSQAYPGVRCESDCYSSGDLLSVGREGSLTIGFEMSPRFGSVSGTVRDADTGKPVAGIEVAARPLDRQLGSRISASTDSNGFYELSTSGYDALFSGTYEVVAAGRDGYIRTVHPDIVCPTDCGDPSPVAVVAGEATTGIDIAMPKFEVSGISPVSGPTTGRWAVAISGKHFLPGVQAAIDAMSAPVLHYTRQRILVAVPSLSAGRHHVIVTNSDGQQNVLPHALLNDDSVAPPGDANGDLALSVADVFFLIQHFFAAGPAPVDGDANLDGVADIADLFFLINVLFNRG